MRGCLRSDNPPTFQPDYAVPPGHTLRELIQSKGLTQSDLAERTGRPKKTINEIVQGKAAITPDTALQLERVLGVDASFWINMERGYRTALAKAAEREQLAEHVGWLSTFPVKEMVRRKWLRPASDDVAMVREVLKFFGVASPSAWEDVWDHTRRATALRQVKSKTVDFGAVAAWLRKGEIGGREIQTASYEPNRFKDCLRQIRALTTALPDKFCREIRELCRGAGVAVTFVPEMPRAGLFGAARWLSSDKALIQLSLYQKREDQFWFSFFHEAAHILLHGRREVFVDVHGASADRQEEEANKFARDILISAPAYNAFVGGVNITKESVVRFAREQEIAPAIVVGRLQHDRVLAFNQMHDLVRKLAWDSSSEE